ncbi:MAG: mannose-1-phosphate guanylyltransferase [bacterium]|nr:mannose-1-phosphate guanylyltransferase [bacterium]
MGRGDIRRHIHAVIMAGGGGERFWPRSRRSFPKQLHRLFGPRSMLQETADRIAALVPPERLIVVTNKAQAPRIRRQLPSVPKSSIVAEPFGRDTAACIALGAAIVMERDENGIMVVLPADHVIRNRRALVRNLLDACRAAAAGDRLVTFGIRPTYPSTGYGYIRRGATVPLRTATRFFRVRRFAEKPDAATARRYIRGGDYLWNSGMFVWRASAIAAALERHMPALHRGYLEMRKGLSGPRPATAIRRVYGGLERISIDYGVMEKADNVIVAEAGFDWDDAGSWLALERHLPADRDGNVLVGEGVALGTERCIVVSDAGMVACHGVRDLIVVRTPDAVLVCHRDSAQEIKRIIARLRERRGWTRYT